MDSNQIVEEQKRNDKMMKRALICSVLFFLIGSAFVIYLVYQNVVGYIEGTVRLPIDGDAIANPWLILGLIVAAPLVIVFLILIMGIDALIVPALIELGVVIISNLIFFMPYMVNALKRGKKSQKNNKERM